MARAATLKKPAAASARRKPAKPKAADAGSRSMQDVAAPGLFITLEGGEGAGKSTQITMLAEKLRTLGATVVTTREPGGSPGAEAVRHVLLSGAAESLGPELEAILFSASRADHVTTVIRPAIEAGSVVLCDRFYDSTRVYQGVEGKLSPEFIAQLERVAVGDTIPDLTLILDIDPKEGMKRASARRKAGETADRFEKESVARQQARRKAFLRIARAEPDRCTVIDAGGTARQVFARVWKAVEARLGDRLKVDGRKAAGTRRKPAAGRKGGKGG